MKKLILYWWYKPAYPWEFWLPQSGLPGAVLAICFIIMLMGAFAAS